VLVVLLGSTPDAWYSDAEALLDYGFTTLASPGRLPSFDRVSAELTRTAGDLLPATTAVQDSANVAGPVTITASSTVPQPRREGWFWPITAALAVVLALVGIAQAERLAGTLASRRNRALGPATAAIDGSDWSESRAIRTVSRQSPMRGTAAPALADPLDFTADLPIVQRRARTHQRETGRKASTPAFGFFSD
jgi:hypothetical protein